MTIYEKFRELDYAITEILEGEGTGAFSIVLADNHTVYLAIIKPHSFNKHFNDVLASLEANPEFMYIDKAQRLEIDATECRYPIGYTEQVYRAHRTCALLEMQVDENTFDLTDAIKHDLRFEEIVMFLEDNPDFVLRVIDGKTVIVKEGT